MKTILQMLKITTIYIVLILFSSSSLSAQNKLWLANGKKKEIGEYKLSDKQFVLYKNAKGKSKSIERFDVFAIVDETSNKESYKHQLKMVEAYFYKLLQ